MKAASRELSSELYTLSRWSNTDYIYVEAGHKPAMVSKERAFLKRWDFLYPAYDLSYLFEKLKLQIYQQSTNDQLKIFTMMIEHNQPADVLTKLAIELFKQGILTLE